MFDPAILNSLEIRLPPEPPLMVEERIVRDPADERFARIGARMADGFDEDANRYIEAMAGMQRRLDGAKAVGTGTAEDMARFTRAIEDLERVAEYRAQRAAKVKKRIERQSKAEAKTAPSIAVARRQIGARLFATDKRLIDALLDHTLFLRALRSEMDPTAQDAPTFSDAASLHDHLARLGAV